MTLHTMHILRYDLLIVENLSRAAAIEVQSKGGVGAGAEAIQDQEDKGDVSPEADVGGGGSVVTNSQAYLDTNGVTNSSPPSEFPGKIFRRDHGGGIHQGPNWGVGGEYQEARDEDNPMCTTEEEWETEATNRRGVGGGGTTLPSPFFPNTSEFIVIVFSEYA